jgi:hypothetical protein
MKTSEETRYCAKCKTVIVSLIDAEALDDALVHLTCKKEWIQFQREQSESSVPVVSVDSSWDLGFVPETSFGTDLDTNIPASFFLGSGTDLDTNIPASFFLGSGTSITPSGEIFTSPPNTDSLTVTNENKIIPSDIFPQPLSEDRVITINISFEIFMQINVEHSLIVQLGIEQWRSKINQVRMSSDYKNVDLELVLKEQIS